METPEKITALLATLKTDDELMGMYRTCDSLAELGKMDRALADAIRAAIEARAEAEGILLYDWIYYETHGDHAAAEAKRAGKTRR